MKASLTAAVEHPSRHLRDLASSAIRAGLSNLSELALEPIACGGGNPRAERKMLSRLGEDHLMHAG
jgi:hypothetical protein